MEGSTNSSTASTSAYPPGDRIRAIQITSPHLSHYQHQSGHGGSSSSAMAGAGQLASVPEESATELVAPAPYPAARTSYREWIRSISGPELIGSAVFSRLALFSHPQSGDSSSVRAVLHMYICVSSASHDMFTTRVISSEAQSILKEIGTSLDRQGSRFIGCINDTMMQVKQTLVKDGDSWAFEIPRGGGEVHRNIRFLVGCILLMRNTKASTDNSAQNHNTEKLRDLIHDMINFLKELLLIKSELCLDQSLRYMFLLNNSHFIAQMTEPSVSLDLGLRFGHHQGLILSPECEKYMGSYLDVSWGHVLSFIQQPKIPGLLHHWMNTSSPSSLAKFRLAFHKTHQAQKFWKVPDPQLRDVLRKAIAERVISAYRNFEAASGAREIR